MNNAYLYEGLIGGIRSLEIIVGKIPPPKWDTPTGPGRFTPREVIAHLADWEPRLRARLEAALQGNEPSVEAWNESDLAVQNRYSETDYRERLAHYVGEREKTIALLQSLKSSDFGLAFLHPEKGRMTIEDQSAFLMGHDLYHLDQLSEII